jgi:putative transcriptional regulator
MSESLKGRFLVATPSLRDPNFFRTVILLVEHGEKGSMGMVVNRPLPKTIGEAWKQVSEKPCANPAPLYDGGPCPSPLIALHTHEEQADMPVLPGLFLTMSGATVKDLVENSVTPIKFLVGSAGWAGGQLENEIQQGAWLLTMASAEQVFYTYDDQWLDLTRAVARATAAPNLDPKFIPPDPRVN